MSRLGVLLTISAIGLLPLIARAESWTLTHSNHFELYSQTSDAQARKTLLWFEQLRAFFTQQTGVDLAHPVPVRVIAFRSSAEFQQYRRGASTDAFYVGTPTRDYIVMMSGAPSELRIAAHEYAHLILRASGLHHPSWLNEGLAEFFSTLSIGEGGTMIGEDLPANSQTLRRRNWMPLDELLAIAGESPYHEDRAGAELFYAQSWLLAEMLVLSPNYGTRFHDLISRLTLGASGAEAIKTVFGKSTADLTRDLRIWAGDRRRFTPVALPGVASSNVEFAVSAISPQESRFALADLALSAGDLDHAESLYRALAAETPQNAEISAAFGAIAFRRGDRETARREWKQAIDLGIRDAALAFRYAILADEAGLSPDEIRPALQRAVELQPDYDDARFKLALLEKNTGHFEAAAKHLSAMHNIAPARAFSYWIALAGSLTELDRRDEAQAAARRASQFATTAQERTLAAQLAYISQTDLAVAFTKDANGRQQLVTTRIPHASGNFNPFVEAGDDLQRVQGMLREIDCSKPATRFVMEVAGKTLSLTIPDPGHVQMRNAPAEFTCGGQPPTSVSVEYAANGNIIRGLEFH